MNNRLLSVYSQEVQSISLIANPFNKQHFDPCQLAWIINNILFIVNNFKSISLSDDLVSSHVERGCIAADIRTK